MNKPKKSRDDALIKTYTTPEMAKILGVSTATVRNYARDKTFLRPIIKYRGKQKYFEFDETHVQQWNEVLAAKRGGD